MTDIAELKKRVEGLQGPDREVDALVMAALAAPDGSKVEQSPINGVWCIYEPRKYGKEPFALWEWRGWFRVDGWPITASIDAARALVERVLPGWSYASGNVGEDNLPWATLTEPTGACRDFQASADEEPRAIILALLSALEAISAPQEEPQ